MERSKPFPVFSISWQILGMLTALCGTCSTERSTAKEAEEGRLFQDFRNGRGFMVFKAKTGRRVLDRTFSDNLLFKSKEQNDEGNNWTIGNHETYTLGRSKADSIKRISFEGNHHGIDSDDHKQLSNVLTSKFNVKRIKRDKQSTEPNDDSTSRNIKADNDPTCINKCGQTRHTPCSCDVTCFLYKTCCENVTVECPYLEDEARTILGNDLAENNGQVTCDNFNGVFLVTECVWPKTVSPSDTENGFFSALLSMAVVYDNETGIVFKNRRVYNCYKNNTSLLRYWSPSFVLRDNRVISKNLADVPSILKNADPKMASFKPTSKAIEGHRCVDAISTCNKELVHLDPGGLCGKFVSYYSPYRPSPRLTIYENRFCYYCNSNTTIGGYHGVPSFALERTASLALLMEFTSSENGEVTVDLDLEGILVPPFWTGMTCSLQNSAMPIDPAERFVGDNKPSCAQTRCRSEQIMFNGSCVDWYSINVILKHPPTHFKTSNILRLAKFVRCSYDASLSMSHSETLVRRTLSPKYNSNVDYAKEYNVVNADDYLFIRLSYTGNDRMLIDMANEGTDALVYWLIHGGFVAETENGLLYYLVDGNDPIQSTTNGSDFDVDDRGDTDDEAVLKGFNIRQTERNVVMGGVIADLGGVFFSSDIIWASPPPIKSGALLLSDARRKAFDRCYGNRVTSGSTAAARHFDFPALLAVAVSCVVSGGRVWL